MSEPLIHNFRVSHQVIIETLSGIQTVTRSYLDAKPRLLGLRTQLLNHFAKQNDVFFERLRRVHADSRQDLKMLEFLELNLRDSKVQYLMFFDRHSGELGDTSARTFPADFHKFSQNVLARLKTEEEYLLPLMKKL